MKVLLAIACLLLAAQVQGDFDKLIDEKVCLLKKLKCEHYRPKCGYGGSLKYDECGCTYCDTSNSYSQSYSGSMGQDYGGSNVAYGSNGVAYGGQQPAYGSQQGGYGGQQAAYGGGYGQQPAYGGGYGQDSGYGTGQQTIILPIAVESGYSGSGSGSGGSSGGNSGGSSDAALALLLATMNQGGGGIYPGR